MEAEAQIKSLQAELELWKDRYKKLEQQKKDGEAHMKELEEQLRQAGMQVTDKM